MALAAAVGIASAVVGAVELGSSILGIVSFGLDNAPQNHQPHGTYTKGRKAYERLSKTFANPSALRF